jgi:hypothetical protein
MSQRREAVLEILSAVTGLSAEEVETKQPLRQLLEDVDVAKPGEKSKKVSFRCFHFFVSEGSQRRWHSAVSEH